MTTKATPSNSLNFFAIGEGSGPPAGRKYRATYEEAEADAVQAARDLFAAGQKTAVFWVVQKLSVHSVGMPTVESVKL